MAKDNKKEKETAPSYGDFVFEKTSSIKELQADLVSVEHRPTKAKILHIKNDDPENLFCLSLQTLPSSSNGVAHVLEHTVLCGSKKFPVKDPFFSMNKRSLNTFMNALTGSDFTCYPAASQSPKDFYNLLEVYLDAVFSPSLNKMSFLQEGHRLSLSADSLIDQGIVFNEMKGSLNNPESRLWYALMSSLLPDLPYAHNSGGDPKDIPSLTHEDLLAFHTKYYHPSRALFFFYGNMDTKSHLDFLEKHLFSQELPETPPPLEPIPKQKRFKTPKTLSLPYPATEGNTEHFVSIAWLTAPIKSQETLLALSVLDIILMDTDASLLKEPLLQSKLCTEANSFLDTEMSEVPYGIICKGCGEKTLPFITSLILEELEKIIKKGIPQKLAERALHQLELDHLEINRGRYPFGLNLFFRTGLLHQHHCSPKKGLKIYSLFKSLRKKLESQPKFLESLAEKYLLHNLHRVDILMKPDAKLEEREELTRKKELQQIYETLQGNSQGQKQLKALETENAQLLDFQRKCEGQSIDCLPKLRLSDIPKEVSKIPLNRLQADQLSIFQAEVFTNHFTYMDCVFDIPYLSEKDLPYAKLLTLLLPELGMGKRSYQKNLAYIQEYTGGLSIDLALNPQCSIPSFAKPSLCVRSKALSRNKHHMFLLLQDLLTSADLTDKARIAQLILQFHTEMESALNTKALHYASLLATEGFSVGSYIENQWHGLPFLLFIRNLVKNLDASLTPLLVKLKKIHKTLFHLNNPHLILSCDEEDMYHLQEESFFGLSSLSSSPFTPWLSDYKLNKRTFKSQGKYISSPVAFTSQACPSLPYLHPLSPALKIASKILSNGPLHKRIREEGGAYGGGATYAPLTGKFHLYSYRDPHLAKTLQVFEEEISSLSTRKLSRREIEESKLTLIQEEDVPLSPGKKGITAYTRFRQDLDNTKRQEYRNHILKATRGDILEAVHEGLIQPLKKCVTASLAGKKLAKEAPYFLPFTSI